MLYGTTTRAIESPFSLKGQLSGWLIVNENESKLDNTRIGISYIPQLSTLSGRLIVNENESITDNENESEADNTRIGIRYIPEFSAKYPINDYMNLDAELSLNIYGETIFRSTSDYDDHSSLDVDHSDLEIYRSWVRFSTNQFEMRLGLQKLNFGPARILRSMIWFDSLDPQDPLDITNGVWGLLGRYFFINNSNVWLWGLYDNEDLKGSEVVKTDDKKVEYGGRIQYPLFNGEMAITYHHRNFDRNDWALKKSTNLIDVEENRFAIDGIWDVEVGLWFEAFVCKIYRDHSTRLFKNYFTIGSDYTFESGWHVLGEHFIQTMDPKIDETDELNEISAISVDYPVNIVDSISAIIYYNWKIDKLDYYLSWRSSYDDWVIDLLSFSNSNDTDSTFAENGIQLIISYYH